MNLKRYIVRASAGESRPKSEIHPKLTAYVKMLLEASPTFGLETGIRQLDLALLQQAIQSKSAWVAADPDVDVDWSSLVLHEIDANDPTEWITDAIALKYTAEVPDGSGGKEDQHFSISFLGSSS